MQIGSKIGTLKEHFVIFHHIFLVFVEKLTISFIIEATRVKLMKKKKKNNFLPCFRQNVAKTVLTHFLSNLNLKDPSQDVGSNMFNPICFYLLVNAYKIQKKFKKTYILH
jgi:hypothetical protein